MAAGHVEVRARVLKNLRRQKIVLASGYTRISNRHRFKCGLCDRIWKGTLHPYAKAAKSSGLGCTECRARARVPKLKRSHVDYIEILRTRNPTVIPIERYRGCNTRIKHKCLTHKLVWTPVPADVIRGTGCDRCKRDKVGRTHRLTTAQYKARLKSKAPNLLCLQDYELYGAEILHKCRVCKTEMMLAPAIALHFPYACRTCHPSGSYQQYKLGKRTINVMGYESQALDYLRTRFKIRCNQIKVASERNVPRIQIGVNRIGLPTYHTPDIYIPHLNLLVEVKSEATLGFTATRYAPSKREGIERQKQVLRRKLLAEAAGFRYRILCMTVDGRAVKWKHRIHRSLQGFVK